MRLGENCGRGRGIGAEERGQMRDKGQELRFTPLAVLSTQPRAKRAATTRACPPGQEQHVPGSSDMGSSQTDDFFALMSLIIKAWTYRYRKIATQRIQPEEHAGSHGTRNIGSVTFYENSVKYDNIQ
jgi:hypothetical protein